MNDQIRALIARHEQDSFFTRVAPTEEMIASAQRLPDVTIPRQFVDYLREYGTVKFLAHFLTGGRPAVRYGYSCSSDTSR